MDCQHGIGLKANHLHATQNLSVQQQEYDGVFYTTLFSLLQIFITQALFAVYVQLADLVDHKTRVIFETAGGVSDWLNISRHSTDHL